jgi:hypothetical protein
MGTVQLIDHADPSYDYRSAEIRNPLKQAQPASAQGRYRVGIGQRIQPDYLDGAKGGQVMEENIIEVDEILEKGIRVTTVVVDGIIETTIQQSGSVVGDKKQTDPTDIVLIQNPSSAGDPRMQHDLAVRDVHAGEYGDFSEQSNSEAVS